MSQKKIFITTKNILKLTYQLIARIFVPFKLCLNYNIRSKIENQTLFLGTNVVVFAESIDWGNIPLINAKSNINIKTNIYPIWNLF